MLKMFEKLTDYRDKFQDKLDIVIFLSLKKTLYFFALLLFQIINMVYGVNR